MNHALTGLGFTAAERAAAGEAKKRPLLRSNRPGNGVFSSPHRRLINPMGLLLRVWRGSPDPPRFRAIRGLYQIFKKHNSPEARGRRLLRRWLSPAQQAQFDAFNFFDVIGRHTARRYRIHYAAQANVEELDKVGNPVMRYCFIPKGHLVPGDVMLAQKIALETDEVAALELANRFPPPTQRSAGLADGSCEKKQFAALREA